MCVCTPSIRTPYCGKFGCEIPKLQKINVYEEYAWIIVRKRTGEIVTPGGIAFEAEEKVCPKEVLVHPVYSAEYENIRVKIINSKEE